MMKLYHYDHCPFCVRARMIIGLRGLNIEQIPLANDDEATPIGLVGKKMVPILIKADGTAMGESLDIVRYLDEYAGGERLDDTVRPELQTWLNQVNEYSGQLLSPRSTRIGLPEFASESARAYYTAKKSAQYGDFAENLARTDKLLARLHADLPALVPLISAPDHLGTRLGYEDIITFPLLRNLTMVKGVDYPPAVRRYVETMSAQSRVPLFDDRAI
jgi:glutaredoxin, grxB family